MKELLAVMPSIQRDGFENIISAMDIDKDGRIDLAEFLRWHLATDSTPSNNRNSHNV